MNFPYEFENLDDDHQKEISLKFLNQPEIVCVGPEKWFLPKPFKEYANKIHNFNVRPTDVFVCTFPRSGTTWTQEMILLICNDLDYETAKKISLRKRFPYLEINLLTSEKATREMAIINKKFLSETNAEIDIQTYDPIDKVLEAQTTQRFIKIHLPMQFLPWKIKEVGAKVVYVARNPKDVAVSYFYFEKNPIFAYNGDFETYSDFFMNDQVIYAPYWKHVLDGWEHRHESNFHFMFYEDLKLNTEESLRKLSKFLEKPLKDEDLPKLLDHLNFDNAKENLAVNAVNLMLRKGCIGGNSEMTEEISAKFDKWSEENLRESDLKFPVKFT